MNTVIQGFIGVTVESKEPLLVHGAVPFDLLLADIGIVKAAQFRTVDHITGFFQILIKFLSGVGGAEKGAGRAPGKAVVLGNTEVPLVACLAKES